MSATRIANVVLLSLWALCIAHALFTSLWYFSPATLDYLDQQFRNNAKIDHTPIYEKIIADYEKDNDHQKAIDALSSIITDMQDVQKTDFHYPTKQTTFEQIIRIAVRQSRLDTAIHWTRVWLQADPVDIEANLSLGRLLLVNPTTSLEGEAQLDLLKKRFPDALVVANGRAIAYAWTGNIGRSFLELAPFFASEESSEHALKKKFGETTEVIPYKHIPSDAESSFDVTFDRPASLEIEVKNLIDNAPIKFKATGLTTTSYGYRKFIGDKAGLQLRDVDKSAGLNFEISVKSSPPQILDLILKNRALLIEQLTTAGETQTLKLLEGYDAST
jgi:hypothetical protein